MIPVLSRLSPTSQTASKQMYRIHLCYGPLSSNGVMYRYSLIKICFSLELVFLFDRVVVIL